MNTLDYCIAVLIAIVLGAMFAYGWSMPGLY